jgi:hypothetical protein
VKVNRVFAGVLIGCLSGCATILSGVDQEISVTTTPAGAECELYRDGKQVGGVAATPGNVLVRKTRQDLKLICKKEGYLPTESVLASGSEAKTYVNILFGGAGLVMWGLDAVAGADNRYPDAPSITLASPAASTTKPRKAS